MADQVAVRVNKTNINEGGVVTVTAAFRDRATAAAAAPSTVHYKIFNRSVGKVLRDWTLVTASSSVTITLDPSLNEIQSGLNQTESIEVIVVADRSMATEVRGSTKYTIRNVEGYDTQDVENDIAEAVFSQTLDKPATGDLLHIIDVSDTTASPSGTPKLTPYFFSSDYAGDIRNFGADPTGVEDSTAAIQACIDADLNPYIPYGDWRLDGEIIPSSEVTIVCERGTEAGPNAWRAFPAINVPQNNYCRIFKDDASQNTPFFHINWRNQHILGWPTLCVKDKTSYTSTAVEFKPGTANSNGFNNIPGIWGNTIQVVGTGNRTTIGQEGEGMTVVGIDWVGDGSQEYGYCSMGEIDIYCQNVRRAFDDPGIEGAAANRNMWGNTYFVRVNVDGAKQAIRCKRLSGNVFEGVVQSRDLIHPNEVGEAMVHITTSKNLINIKPWDLKGTPRVGGDDDGLYRHALFLRNSGSGNTVTSTIATAHREVRGNIQRANHHGVLGAPRGVIPYMSRKSGDFGNGMVVSPFYDQLWCLEDRFTVTVSVYKGTSYDFSDVAVSDLVCSNASGSSLDITSALGELPTFLVGEKFTMQDHSEHFNNVVMTVNAIITDGYTVACSGPLDENLNGNGYSAAPVNAAAEAVTIVRDWFSDTSDGVTGGRTVSTDISLTNEDYLFQITGNYCTYFANADAVADGDVIEIRVTGMSGIRFADLYTSQLANGAFKRQHVITKNNSGDVLDNLMKKPPNEADENPQDLVHFSCGSYTPSEMIIRFAEPRDDSKAGTFMDIFAIDETGPEPRAGYYINKQGDQAVLNGFGVNGHFRNPRYTTAEIEDAEHQVNTDGWKDVGAQIYNTDTKKVLYANGNGDTDTWLDALGVAVHTPV